MPIISTVTSVCDGHLNLKEQLRLMDDCDRWARRAEAAEAQVGRLKRALNDLAEAAEVAAQGGIHPAHIDGNERSPQSPPEGP